MPQQHSQTCPSNTPGHASATLLAIPSHSLAYSHVHISIPNHNSNQALPRQHFKSKSLAMSPTLPGGLHMYILYTVSYTLPVWQHLLKVQHSCHDPKTIHCNSLVMSSNCTALQYKNQGMCQIIILCRIGWVYYQSCSRHVYLSCFYWSSWSWLWNPLACFNLHERSGKYFWGPNYFHGTL